MTKPLSLRVALPAYYDGCVSAAAFAVLCCCLWCMALQPALGAGGVHSAAGFALPARCWARWACTTPKALSTLQAAARRRPPGLGRCRSAGSAWRRSSGAARSARGALARRRGRRRAFGRRAGSITLLVASDLDPPFGHAPAAARGGAHAPPWR
jgi:hypothetical protein